MRLQGEGTYYKQGDSFCWKLRVGQRSIVRSAKTQGELRKKVKIVLDQPNLRDRGGRRCPGGC